MIKIVIETAQTKEPHENDFIISDEYAKKVVYLFGILPIFSREFFFSSSTDSEQKINKKSKIGF